jgi:hypothetical protein
MSPTTLDGKNWMILHLGDYDNTWPKMKFDHLGQFTSVKPCGLFDVNEDINFSF